MSKSKLKTMASNKARINELAAMISVYADVQLTPDDYGKIQNLRDRLEYGLLELEEQGQELKIRNMENVLEIMKSVKAKIIV